MPLLETVKSYFDRDSLKYRLLGRHSAFELPIEAENGKYRLVVVVDEERSIVRFLTFLEGRIPEARRRDVMEFTTRANYGLLLGNFEMDLGDGEFRFKCSVESEETELTYTQYQTMLYTSVSVMDRYYPGLQRVIQGSADPAAAIADVEAG